MAAFAAESVKFMDCKFCGMPLEDENAAFCPHCGKPLTEQTAAEETAAEAAEEKKTEAAPAAEGTAPGAPKKPNGKLIGIVAAAIAVVAVALILLIPRLKQNAQGETPVAEPPAAEEVQPNLEWFLTSESSEAPSRFTNESFQCVYFSRSER